jgi:pimeloyl-ACP methyl ester carboxylesterase
MTSRHRFALIVTLILTLLCTSPVAVPAQTTGAAQNPPAPIGKLVDVGGYRIHLYCTGTGSPTVVIVGAGFSFDWGLVQPEVAKFTQVCAYDHSGIGWSDPGPKDSCSLRVSEIHTALKNARVKGPYVLVGHSLGALVARLYAGRYPDDVAGMVFADHASGRRIFPPAGAPVPTAPPPPQESPTPPFGGPGAVLGVEMDPNFSKLSSRDRELHLWAISQSQNQTVLRANAEIRTECDAAADAISKENPHPLGDKPLVNVSTDMGRRIPGYLELQAELLSLSRNSKEIVAENSSHFVIVDRPDAVIDAIRQVLQSVRSKTKL